jgi:uncharacterized membrane protein
VAALADNTAPKTPNQRIPGRAAKNNMGSLDTPLSGRQRILPKFSPDPDAFGHATEGFARFMGTPQFLVYMTVFVVVWLAWNTFAPLEWQFDSRDLGFTLLTLMLSLQASYAAPLILLAQYRQEARDRVALERDRAQTAQSRADMDFLAREIAGLRMSVGELATRDYLRSELRAELQSILVDLDAGDEEAAPRAEPTARPSLRHSVERRRQNVDR